MTIKNHIDHDIIPILTTAFFILLAAGCYSVYDYDSYKLLYTGIYSKANLESAFAWLMTEAFGLGISYEAFRFLIIASCYTTLTCVAYKYIKSKVIYIQILYLFSAYAHDFFNLRNFIVTALFTTAFFIAVFSKKHGLIKYVIIVVLGIFFQKTSFFFLLFLYPIIKVKRESYCAIRKSRSLWVVLAMLAATVFVLSETLLNAMAGAAWNIVFYFTGAPPHKVEFFVARGRYGFLLYSMCHLMFTGTILAMKHSISRNYVGNCSVSERKELSLIETVNMCNIIMLFFIPLIKVNSEFYRVFRNLQWIEYITFFVGLNYIKKRTKRKLFLLFLIIVTAGVNFAVIVAPYAEDVFITMFTDNMYLFK